MLSDDEGEAPISSFRSAPRRSRRWHFGSARSSSLCVCKMPTCFICKTKCGGRDSTNQEEAAGLSGLEVGGYCHAQCFAAIKEASSTHWTPQMSHVSWRTQTDPARVFFCGANMLVHVLYTSCTQAYTAGNAAAMATDSGASVLPIRAATPAPAAADVHTCSRTGLGLGWSSQNGCRVPQTAPGSCWRPPQC